MIVVQLQHWSWGHPFVGIHSKSIREKNYILRKIGCGSGSAEIRINFGELDPDPDLGGPKITQKIEESEDILCSEVLDVLF